MAMEAYVAGEGRSSELFGVVGLHGFGSKGLAELVKPAGGFGGDPKEGPVEYANVTLDNDRILASIERGLFLIRNGQDRLAVFVHEGDKIGGWKHMLVEVMAKGLPTAERFLSELREAMRARNVYRGHSSRSRRIFRSSRSSSIDCRRSTERRSSCRRGCWSGSSGRPSSSAARAGLREAGRHLKRGLLLHGAPGTGKTLTVMYLVNAMRDRTALLLTVKGLGLISQTCAMARTLQPSIVILEDVHLIAEDRTKKAGATPFLFELLNEMDGLADDADVLFLLTTNRPDLLEPALASRPGRVDQAIEIPVPDESCRRQLFDLYARGLTLQVADMPRFVARTEGASGAFIRELLRKATLFATASSEGEIIVTDRHLDSALHELVVQGGELTRSLLGFQSRIGFGARDRARGSG